MIEITALAWVPDFPRGQVRDLRLRWACEELGQPYTARLLEFSQLRTDDRWVEQPFGQVPSLKDGELRLFESGACLLHLADTYPGLMPEGAQARADVLSWLFAALSSVEPALMDLALCDLFFENQEAAGGVRPDVLKFIDQRLEGLGRHLEGREFLTDAGFTVADLLMATVLRIGGRSHPVQNHPVVAAYKARCESRLAFRRALDAQLNDFRPLEEGPR